MARRPRRDNLPVGIALFASVLVHLIALGPMLGIVTADRADDPLWTETQPLEAPRDAITLGLDEGVPSSLTWIGYREYEEHLARLSETEQAAFALAEASTPVEAPPPPEPTAEPEQPLATDTEEPAAEEPDAPETGEPAESTPPLPAIDLAPIGDFVGTVREEADRLLDAAQDQLSRAWQSVRQARPRVRAAQETAESTESPDATAPPQPQPPSESPTEKPVEADATPSDRESDATSIIEVQRDQWRAGKPLAARGLTIITRKPEFQTWTLITAAPRNPIVEITFNHAGIVTNARFARSSGHTDVDRAILLAVYGWRAEGERLASIEEGATFTETITFLLTRRR